MNPLRYRFTLPSFLMAFFAGLMLLPATSVVNVNARGLGFEHVQPWRASVSTLASAVRAGARGLLGGLSALHARPWFRPGLAVTCAVIAAIVNPDALAAAPLVIGAVFEEGQHTGEFLLSEANGERSRDNVTVTVPASTTLSAGFVLAKLSASGKYVPYDNSGSDGSEIAAGILYSELRNEGVAPADMDGVVINADAEVREDDLVWDSGVDGSGETAGLADLRSLGIKAR